MSVTKPIIVVASEAGCPVIVLARGMETPLEELLAESEPAVSPT